MERPTGVGGTKTHFAPAERLHHREVERQAEQIAGSPIMDAVLAASGGLLAVLNEQRQIVALNTALLERFGIHDADATLGLRMGEAMRCLNADDNPDGGCGTGRWCATCGAAIAIVTTLVEDKTVERLCILETEDGPRREIHFSVRTHPIDCEEGRWVLLYLQDVSAEQELQLLQRVFFHDVANTVTALVAESQEILEDAPPALLKTARSVELCVSRLVREISMQRLLFQAQTGSFNPRPQPVSVDAAMAELAQVCSVHPAADGQRIRVSDRTGGEVLNIDTAVLDHVLTNMLINAIEEETSGGDVQLWCELRGEEVMFGVTNPGEISAKVARRIFTRSFSTKGGKGRGLGTHSMKLFGEQILNGVVGFTSGDGQTSFTLRLPASCRISH